MKKILVVCKIQDEILEKYGSRIIYKPHLNDFTESEWEEWIQIHKPDIVLFGTIYFTKAMMRIWRKHQPDTPLFIVRKGIGLGRCDLAAAKEYAIEVFNLPGVNTIFVANFMNKFLFKENNPTDCIAIIGTGTIGQKIIQEAINHHMPIMVYSKTLKNDKDLKKKFWFSELPKNYTIKVATTLDQVFSYGNKIAICVPYDKDTKDMIDDRQVKKIPNHSLLVSVSEPKIFSDDALRTLYKRNDLTIVIDHLASEFKDIYTIMNCDHTLRKNFIMVEEAAASSECQQAMSQAALEKCLAM